MSPVFTTQPQAGTEYEHEIHTWPMNDEKWRIPDELWRKMERLLPLRKPHPLGCHNHRVSDRDAMDAAYRLQMVRPGHRRFVLAVRRPSALHGLVPSGNIREIPNARIFRVRAASMRGLRALRVGSKAFGEKPKARSEESETKCPLCLPSVSFPGCLLI